MKHTVFLVVIFLSVSFSLQGQTSSVKINVTPAAYITHSVEQKMEKWLQKDRFESAKEYEQRTSEKNKASARKQFETEASAKYKELFLNNVNWGDLYLLNYNDEEQAFVIQSAVCANFKMPVPKASAQEFEAEFASLRKSNPDFYFEDDVVKFSKLTFSSSKGKTYTYNGNGNGNDNGNANGALAVINWLSPLLSTSETDTKDLRIQVCITSQSQIKSVSVIINDRITRGVSAVQNDGCDLSLSQTIRLSKGMNTVKIKVENAAGQSISDTRQVNYKTSGLFQIFSGPKKQTDMEQNQIQNGVQTSGKRMALVMGNAAYLISPLVNPVNDATDIAAKLKKLGFEVILCKNQTKEQMDRAIDDFGKQAKGYDVALFFYAGHALQYNGKNYLIPVNVSLQEERDIEYKCTSLNRALGRMEDSNTKLNIVLLDACRNNPFERSWRSLNGSGLSFMNAPAGTFIAYSTAPNTVAQDGKGRNSPYTTELLKKLDVKNLKIEELFKQVREAVMKKTEGQQVPWDQSSITGEFYFNF